MKHFNTVNIIHFYSCEHVFSRPSSVFKMGNYNFSFSTKYPISSASYQKVVYAFWWFYRRDKKLFIECLCHIANLAFRTTTLHVGTVTEVNWQVSHVTYNWELAFKYWKKVSSAAYTTFFPYMQIVGWNQLEKDFSQ